MTNLCQKHEASDNGMARSWESAIETLAVVVNIPLRSHAEGVSQKKEKQCMSGIYPNHLALGLVSPTVQIWKSVLLIS